MSQKNSARNLQQLEINSYYNPVRWAFRFALHSYCFAFLQCMKKITILILPSHYYWFYPRITIHVSNNQQQKKQLVLWITWVGLQVMRNTSVDTCTHPFHLHFNFLVTSITKSNSLSQPIMKVFAAQLLVIHSFQNTRKLRKRFGTQSLRKQTSVFDGPKNGECLVIAPVSVHLRPLQLISSARNRPFIPPSVFEKRSSWKHLF